MRVVINGEQREINAAVNINQLLETLELAEARVAVELNRELIRRQKWSEVTINENDRIEIVHFVGGG